MQKMISLEKHNVGSANVEKQEHRKRNNQKEILPAARGSDLTNFSNKNSVIALMPKLYIKNMVCDRCKTAVQKALTDFDVDYTSVELGEIELKTEPTQDQLAQFKAAVEAQGFELIEARNARMISQVKKLILDWVRGQSSTKIKLSAHLADNLHKDYASLSKLFSEIEGATIEQYCILQKIELAKELLVYDELSLTEISERLGYSSLAHLSNQFKKITGLTLMHFKEIGAMKRVPLDKV